MYSQFVQYISKTSKSQSNLWVILSFVEPPFLLQGYF